MIRFSAFVDGSNLVGSLKKINLQVDDYEDFFDHIIRVSQEAWKESLFNGSVVTSLHRVYWYAVGSIDRYNLTDTVLLDHLKEVFNSDKELKNLYCASAGKENQGKAQNEIQEIAWKKCLEAGEKYYNQKKG